MSSNFSILNVPELGDPAQVEVLGDEHRSIVSVNHFVVEERSAACLKSMLKQNKYMDRRTNGLTD
jgi:hypothetical protein